MFSPMPLLNEISLTLAILHSYIFVLSVFLEVSSILVSIFW